MSWNYRVVRRTGANLISGGDWVEHNIVETYYDDRGRVREVADIAAQPHGETLDQLRRCLERMTEALAKPVLDYETYEELAEERKAEGE